MRDRGGRHFVTGRRLARLATFRHRKRLARSGWLVVVLVCTVGGCARGEFGCAALLRGRGCAREAAGFTRAAFPTWTAPTMPPTATSPAAAPLATLAAAVDAITGSLPLLCARLDAGA